MRKMSLKHFCFAFIGVLLAAMSGMVSAPVTAQSKGPAQSATIESVLTGAKLIGKGVVEAYAKDGKTLLVLQASAFKRLFLWYSETVTVPSGVVSSLALGGSVVEFQRRGNVVFIRDRTAGFGNRIAGYQDPRPGQQTGPKILPIALSVRRANEPPIIGILPVVASASDGRVLVDVTKTFSGDIESMSARPQIVLAGLVPAKVNPAASYITSVRVFPENFNIRTHLTFLAKPKDPVAPPRNISLRVGHSIVMLPEKPMAGRRFDPRVGFFRTGSSVTGEDSKFTVHEASGRLDQLQGLIMRYRLEKKNPDAEVSDPVKPIVFYLGREVPDRWRKYIKAGIETWKPVFEAAGFSNAIVARDAPSFKDDPNWTPEDVRFSTVRWIAQPKPNARGPHTVDPRSGEILSSHVEVWPQVIRIFSRFYFGIHSSLDKRADKLPLSEDMQGRLLQYAVAHEVGHAIGLRHNHLASTVYSVAQMRNPDFANKWGANASMMAYGRWNQAAQPGDGVTKFIPTPGPYDYYAVKFGYRVFGKSPSENQKALNSFVDKAQSDRRLRWAAGEFGEELGIWTADPRVLKESTGAERLEATRLGVANILRSLKKLPAATRGNNEELVGAYNQIQQYHMFYLKSVAKLIGGVKANPWTKTGARRSVVPATEQRAAVAYLLGEGARSLEAYRAPELMEKVAIFGGAKVVDGWLASIMDVLFVDRPIAPLPQIAIGKLPLLQAQRAADPNAYGPLDFANDTYKAVWGDLKSAPHWQRVLRRAYLQKIGELFKAEMAVNPAVQEKTMTALIGQGIPLAFATVVVSAGTDTIFTAWARDMLPKLEQRLKEAARKAKDPDERFHFLAMATQARHVARLGN